jgi:hypothetical protein
MSKKIRFGSKVITIEALIADINAIRGGDGPVIIPDPDPDAARRVDSFGDPIGNYN